MATYSTSAQCATRLLINDLGVNSRPTELQMDGFRDDAYAIITDVIGTGVSDIRNVARTIEISLVRKAVLAALAGEIHYEMKLTDQQLAKLQNTFLSGISLLFEPGENT